MSFRIALDVDERRKRHAAAQAGLGEVEGHFVSPVTVQRAGTAGLAVGTAIVGAVGWFNFTKKGRDQWSEVKRRAINMQA